MKYDLSSRLEIAKSLWRLFISDAQKIKVHYGKTHIAIFIQMKETIDSEDVLEATITDWDRYQELKNVPMPRTPG